MSGPTRRSSKDSRGEPSIPARGASAGHRQSRRRSSPARLASSARTSCALCSTAGAGSSVCDVRGFAARGTSSFSATTSIAYRSRSGRSQTRRGSTTSIRRHRAERDRSHGDDHRPRVPRHEPDDRDPGEHPRDGERPRGDAGLRHRPGRELLLDRGASERRIPADRRQSPHRSRREGAGHRLLRLVQGRLRASVLCVPPGARRRLPHHPPIRRLRARNDRLGRTDQGARRRCGARRAAAHRVRRAAPARLHARHGHRQPRRSRSSGHRTTPIGSSSARRGSPS